MITIIIITDGVFRPINHDKFIPSVSLPDSLSAFRFILGIEFCWCH
jgi:hypothetical protein